MTVSWVFGFLSAVLSFVAAIPYLRDVLKGKTTLERGSYTIWLILPVVALVAQYLEGARESLGLAVADTIIAVVFFALCFRYGYKGVNKRDALALAIALTAVLASIAVSSTLLALLGAIFADAIAMFLIIMKVFEVPKTETTSAWLLYAIAAACAIIAVGSLKPSLLVYPAYVMLSAIIVLIAQQVGLRRSIAKNNHSGTQQQKYPAA